MSRRHSFGRLLYVLDGNGAPAPCDDALTWAEWMAATDRRVALSTVGASEISTVFLGVNQALDGPPLLWETMIFGGPMDRECWRYSSLAAALEGHSRLVARVTGAPIPPAGGAVH